MLPNSVPHLRIRRPSPKTVEFIVSNSAATSLPIRILLAVTTTFRIVTSLFVLILLFYTYQLSSFNTALQPYTFTPEFLTIDYIKYQTQRFISSRLGQRCMHFALQLPIIILLPSSLFILYILSRRFHKTESLLVLRSLGVQTSSSSMIFGIGNTTRFIPTEKIQDILINEAFRGFEVRYYLIVVVEGEKELVVVFPGLSPRLDIVEKVWRGSRACLWEEADKNFIPNVHD
ncbi:Phosphatidylinositol N-acetylglucosaminyltransferase subunit gpi15 [Erysiphe neolycopersici]|uniref:Phosphatidylinositol N-acetylglucosaminyltransferase subunit gpi15 n=1 Tax=Erysiphe neolycopersici TaxID=212602 RepID=A0A420I2Y4_9PEZI|nr:Phosphatidylinositol N-acetylglucosaminyltransferase subunit gpi15 [Erysiphe neolycopersici]